MNLHRQAASLEAAEIDGVDDEYLATKRYAIGAIALSTTRGEPLNVDLMDECIQHA